MTQERLSLKKDVTRLFDSLNYPTLSSKEIERNVDILVAPNEKTSLCLEYETDKTNCPNILITGMPHLGKTTTLKNIKSQADKDGLPLGIVKEGRASYPLDLGDEYAALSYCMTFAHAGLNELTKRFVNNHQISIYDGGLFEQIAFLKALDKTMAARYQNGETVFSDKYIKRFQDYLALFLPEIDGVIIVNANPQVSITNGSTTNPELLKNIHDELTNLPQTLSKMKDFEYPVIPIIHLYPNTISESADLIKKSIYTLIPWNLHGSIIQQ